MSDTFNHRDEALSRFLDGEGDEGEIWWEWDCAKCGNTNPIESSTCEACGLIKDGSMAPRCPNCYSCEIDRTRGRCVACGFESITWLDKSAPLRMWQVFLEDARTHQGVVETLGIAKVTEAHAAYVAALEKRVEELKP